MQEKNEDDDFLWELSLHQAPSLSHISSLSFASSFSLSPLLHNEFLDELFTLQTSQGARMVEFIFLEVNTIYLSHKKTQQSCWV